MYWMKFGTQCGLELDAARPVITGTVVFGLCVCALDARAEFGGVWKPCGLFVAPWLLVGSKERTDSKLSCGTIVNGFMIHLLRGVYALLCILMSCARWKCQNE